MKHTPGPWKADRHFESVVSDNGTFICFTVKPGMYPEPHVEANARLIAAAPELLKNLESIVIVEDHKYNQRIQAANIHNNTDGVGIDFDYISADPLPEWVIQAKLIIQKAKGNTTP
jgi:hypothetical protein